MATAFTDQELNTIAVWASQAAAKAEPKRSYMPWPYDTAMAIFDKAHKERMERQKKGREG